MCQDIKDSWSKVVRHAQAASSPKGGAPFSVVTMTIVTDENGEPLVYTVETKKISPKKIMVVETKERKVTLAGAALLAHLT